MNDPIRIYGYDAYGRLTSPADAQNLLAYTNNLTTNMSNYACEDPSSYKLTPRQKAEFSTDVQALLLAGFMNFDLTLTNKAREFLISALFDQLRDKLVSVAKAELAEKEKQS